MDFRRSGQRDERRRRVLMDEKLLSPDETEEPTPPRSRKSAPGASSPTGRSYSDEALHERQPRVVDFLATRLWTLWVLVLSAATLVAALATAFVYLPEISRFVPRAELGAIDLAGPSSLGAWFSSLLFTLAAGGSLLIYSFRRHKINDYRGRYRVWLPAAVVLLLLSIDASTGLHRLATGALVRLSGVKGFGDGAIWSVSLYGLLMATFGVRLAIEMRRSRSATAAVSLAAVCYGLAAPIWLGAWLSADATLSALAQSVAALLGHVAISTSVGLYARYVYLDAQGRLLPAKPKAKKPKPSKSKPADGDAKDAAEDESPGTTAGKTRRIDAAHTEAPAPKMPPTGAPTSSSTKTPGPLAAKMAATVSSGSPAPRFGEATAARASATMTRPAASDDDDEDDDGDDDDAQLSKAERRRLKKLGRRR